jgi:WW domain-containing oxidoreductase
MSCEPGSLGCHSVLAASLGWRSGGRFGAASTAEEVTEGMDLAGRVYLITGASSPLGRELTRVLTLRGARVVVASRVAERAEAVAADVRALVRDAAVTAMGGLDLGDADATRRFASAFCARALPLTGIICCAAVTCAPFARTADGRESHFGVNHLGHFHLVHLLCGELIRTAASSGVQGRVVIVSSNAHHFTYRVRRGTHRAVRTIGFANLDDDVGYDPVNAYAQSKLANALHAAELHERFRAAGVNVAAFAAHPGFNERELARAFNFPGGSALAALMRGRLTKTPETAAATVARCAAAERRALEGAGSDFGEGDRAGRYHADCAPRRSSLPARDPRLARALWEESERLLGMKPGEARPAPERARSESGREGAGGERGRGVGGARGPPAAEPPASPVAPADAMTRGEAIAAAPALAAAKTTPGKSGRWGLGLAPAKKAED